MYSAGVAIPLPRIQENEDFGRGVDPDTALVVSGLPRLSS